MVSTGCTRQLELFEVGRRRVTVDFQGGQIVSDGGLLAVRNMERGLGILAEAARRLPDPRCQEQVTHTTERILTQRVYQLLGGYFDGNDAQTLRDDPLFQTLADVAPQDEQPLASGSTLNRFAQAYTRRDAQLPPEERPVLSEQRQAHLERIKALNRYLVDLFIATRTDIPERVVLDMDATDDPTHGEQQLRLFHGHYGQHQYLPLLVFEGQSGFPLAAWLRPGTAHASWGAGEVLREIVTVLREAWPEVPILVRGDCGYAVPEVYRTCEELGLLYALGYASNAVLKRRTQLTLNYAQARFELYGEKEVHFQDVRAYQADSWEHCRRVIAKVEVNAQGTNRRFVVTNMTAPPQEIYHGFYVQRGDVPERPIHELKNGLQADRLSSHRFLANSFTLLCHMLAYAIVVLFREANAHEPELATAEVATLRERVFKVGAVVQTSVRRIWFHFSSSWPRQNLLVQIRENIDRYLLAIRQACGQDPPGAATAQPF